eukprot:3068978-Pleurochrysis_carterae.AAC.3
MARTLSPACSSPRTGPSCATERTSGKRWRAEKAMPSRSSALALCSRIHRRPHERRHRRCSTRAARWASSGHDKIRKRTSPAGACLIIITACCADSVATSFTERIRSRGMRWPPARIVGWITLMMANAGNSGINAIPIRWLTSSLTSVTNRSCVACRKTGYIGLSDEAPARAIAAHHKPTSSPSEYPM